MLRRVSFTSYIGGAGGGGCVSVGGLCSSPATAAVPVSLDGALSAGAATCVRIPASLSSPITGVAATSCNLLEPRRLLKLAKSSFGFYLARRGQRRYPFLRRPHIKNTHSMNLKAPYYWSYMTAKSQSMFLPEENYIVGDWTGKFFVSKRQVYTLQHATSGAKVRVKSFPSVFEFTNSPSRWNIGKEMNTLVKPRMDLIDDQMLTKKQRMDYVKAGLLPK